MPLSTASITSVDDYSPIFTGDTLNPFIAQFWTWSAALAKFIPMDLTGLSISMKLQNSVGTIKVCTGVWVVDDAVNGKAHYPYQAGDVDTAGVWQMFIEVTNAGGKIQHADTKVLQILPII